MARTPVTEALIQDVEVSTHNLPGAFGTGRPAPRRHKRKSRRHYLDKLRADAEYLVRELAGLLERVERLMLIWEYASPEQRQLLLDVNFDRELLAHRFRRWRLPQTLSMLRDIPVLRTEDAGHLPLHELLPLRHEGFGWALRTHDRYVEQLETFKRVYPDDDVPNEISLHDLYLRAHQRADERTDRLRQRMLDTMNEEGSVFAAIDYL